MEKLMDKLCNEYGMDEMEILEEYAFESIVPGICTNCETVTDCIEPDSRDGWCENCERNDVKSVLIIAGIV